MKWINTIFFFAIFIFAGCDEILKEDSDESMFQEPDYTQSWVGRYDGAADAYDATNGQSYEDLSTTMQITKSQDNNINARINVDGVIFSASGTINSRTRIQLQNQTGNNRTSISLNRSGDNVTGSATIERQRTSGGYELIREVEINVTKQ